MRIATYFFILLTPTLMVSCTEQEITRSFIILAIIAFIIALRASVKQQNRKDEKYANFCSEKGISETKPLGDYVGGHPSLDQIIQAPLVYIKDKKVNIGIRTLDDKFKVMATIDIDNIQNIYVKDASEIHKEVTLGRVLLVGVFALAWKKKKKDEMAFLCVEWNKGKFDNQTLFKYEGKNAMQKANTDRNYLVRNCQ